MSVVTRERTIEPPLDSSTNSAQLSVVHVCAVHVCKCSLMCAQSRVHTALLQGSKIYVQHVYRGVYRASKSTAMCIHN